MTRAGVNKARTTEEKPRAGGWPSIRKTASGWPTLSGLVYERVGSFSCPFPCFSFLISIFQFGGATRFSVFETICDADVLQPGGWPGLNSEKRLWVAHPCGFVFLQGRGLSLPLFYFLISIF